MTRTVEHADADADQHTDGNSNPDAADGAHIASRAAHEDTQAMRLAEGLAQSEEPPREIGLGLPQQTNLSRINSDDGRSPDVPVPGPSARRPTKRTPWFLAQVIDAELPFVGKLLWVKGPPETFTVGGCPPVRTLRTNIRIRGKWVYIRLASIELTRFGSDKIKNAKHIEKADVRVPSTGRRYDCVSIVKPSQLVGGFAKEMRDA